jgi:hypothetical protein
MEGTNHSALAQQAIARFCGKRQDTLRIMKRQTAVLPSSTTYRSSMRIDLGSVRRSSMPPNYEDFFRQYERQKELERQAAEQEAKVRAKRRGESHLALVGRYDAEIRSLLRGYAAVKMCGTPTVTGPTAGSTAGDYLIWNVACAGYLGVSAILRLAETSSGELTPQGFTIRGTTRGEFSTGASALDLANALAPSLPTPYVPPSCSCVAYQPSCSCDSHTSCSCDSHGSMSYSTCP